MKLRLLLHDVIPVAEAVSENDLYKAHCVRGQARKYIPKNVRDYKEHVRNHVVQNATHNPTGRHPIIAHYYVFTRTDKDSTNFIKALEDSVFEAIDRNDRDVVQSIMTKVDLPEGSQDEEIHVYLFEVIGKYK